jgi:hypothetical protein
LDFKNRNNPIIDGKSKLNRNKKKAELKPTAVVYPNFFIRKTDKVSLTPKSAKDKNDRKLFANKIIEPAPKKDNRSPLGSNASANSEYWKTITTYSISE